MSVLKRTINKKDKKTNKKSKHNFNNFHQNEYRVVDFDSDGGVCYMRE